MTISIANITFDCRDAMAQARFWAEALGRTPDEGAQAAFVSIGYPGEPGQPAWLFLQVPEGKTAKNRMHLDLTSGGDLEAEITRLVELGATKVEEHDELGYRWTVMRDPEGNEFCIA